MELMLSVFRLDSGMTEQEWKVFCKRYINRDVSTLLRIIHQNYNIQETDDSINRKLERELSKLNVYG